MAYAELAMTERVLDNLITNAIAYSPEGSRVELCLTGDDQWQQAAKDNGPGIPPKNLDRMLEPFYRGAQPCQPAM